jgi:hypothetical protein
VFEIQELLLDESIDGIFGKLNPLQDCECFSIKAKFKKKKSNATFKAYYFIMVAHFLVLHIMVYSAFNKSQDDLQERVLSGNSLMLNLSYISYLLIFMCLVMNTVLSYKDPGL